MNKYILTFILIGLIVTSSGCFRHNLIIDEVNATIQKSKFFKSVSITNTNYAIKGNAWYVKEDKVLFIGPAYSVCKDFFGRKIQDISTEGLQCSCFDDKVSGWRKDLSKKISLKNAEGLIIPLIPNYGIFGNSLWADTPRRIVAKSNLANLKFVCNTIINGQTWKKYGGTCRMVYKNSGIHGKMELLIDQKGKSIVEIYETRDKYLALIRRIWYGNVNCNPEKYSNLLDCKEIMMDNFAETYNEAGLQDFIKKIDKH
jgi:hypothetical protein